ncbi:protein tyrosine phosphatase receptor type Na isoform X2 [Dunckerocampus dactyliophorus]|uniref:protein tyrosine phosphatase receptor type Na isoform X2 n=1 Tax=Dunckerocampus dactyliophorus TaxID=161453 RepID=UPI002405AA27|nr:protein tyrosine phosphatase receptor type Na isoform X2 [Dunckerocampus dactyliophorus]
MQHLRTWRVVLLLTMIFHPGMSDRYGCLFERKLCSRDQFCSDDGLFGQCRSSKQDRVQYQVTVPVLKRMQEVLKQLMLQGLSWQDDITQYILSKELKRVPHVTQSAKPNSSSQLSLSKQQVPHHHSSKSGSVPPAGNYMDYMIVEPPRSPLQMQAASIDPYTYHQHRHQDEAERSIIGGGYARTPSWSPANQRGRERDSQLLQEALSLYLASAPPSYRHRGATSVGSAGLPYYDDLQLEVPVDYVEDYTLEERLGTMNQQQPLQNKKVSQGSSAQSGSSDGLLQRMSGVLQKYGVDPKELSQEQLYKLALILQLLQTQDNTQDPNEKDLTLQEMQLLKTDSMPRKLERPASANAPQSHRPSATTTPSTKITEPLPSVPQSPLVSPEEGAIMEKQGPPPLDDTGAKEEYGYIVTNQSLLSLYDGVKLLELLAERIHLATSSFINISVVGPALTFRIRQNEHNMTAAEVAAKAVSEKNFLESETSLKIVQSGVGERTNAQGLPQVTRVSQGSSGTVITLVSMAVVGGVLILAVAVACLRHYGHQVANGKLGLGPEGGAETHFDYQELCRQHMASKSSLCRQECVGGGSSAMAGSAGGTGAGGRRGTDTSRVSSVSSQFSDGPQHSPSSTHSSTPSWSEEPAQSNMDISTGHVILAYMEDHLRNKDRLQKEWEALCSYQADPSSVAVAQTPSNMDKNRQAESLPCQFIHIAFSTKTTTNTHICLFLTILTIIPDDHSRVKLKREQNPRKQDYINASFISDHDPRQPAYIATQGPLTHTVADFWQMVWENGCTVIVMMSALVEDGQKQSERYWPDEGSSLYHIYEVNLVSEHIWCKDFLVRSFYLKNVQTQETRTLTQFHLLSWPADGIPTSTRPLLDFRRKVNKCYRGRSCPIIVHCSDGTGRTGTYILIDMVLNRMAKGVKEIDIAATLEHIRDQRPGLVRTKDQFEFALTAVAEEVNAILKALPQ